MCVIRRVPTPITTRVQRSIKTIQYKTTCLAERVEKLSYWNRGDNKHTTKMILFNVTLLFSCFFYASLQARATNDLDSHRGKWFNVHVYAGENVFSAFVITANAFRVCVRCLKIHVLIVPIRIIQYCTQTTTLSSRRWTNNRFWPTTTGSEEQKRRPLLAKVCAQ